MGLEQVWGMNAARVTENSCQVPKSIQNLIYSNLLKTSWVLQMCGEGCAAGNRSCLLRSNVYEICRINHGNCSGIGVDAAQATDSDCAEWISCSQLA